MVGTSMPSSGTAQDETKSDVNPVTQNVKRGPEIQVRINSMIDDRKVKGNANP